MLGRCCISQAHNGQAFNYFKFAYENSILYGEEEIKKKSIYNMALCNNKLGNIDEALKYVEKYIAVCDMEKDFLLYSYCIILKANCYYYKEDFNKAIEVLNNLLDHFNDRTHIIVGNIYNNLGVLYCKQGDFKKSRECFNISEDIRRNKDMKNLSHTFMEKSVLYTQQQRYEDSINLIKIAIELAERYNDMEYILKGHQELIKIYKLLNRRKEAKVSYTQILKLFTNKGTENYKDEAVKNSVELLRILLSEKDMENAMNILDILENIYGTSEKNGI